MREVGAHMRVRTRVVHTEDAAVDRVPPEVLGRGGRNEHRDRGLCEHRERDEPDRETGPAGVGGEHRHVGEAGRQHQRDVDLVGEPPLGRDREDGRAGRDDERERRNSSGPRSGEHPEVDHDDARMSVPDRRFSGDRCTTRAWPPPAEPSLNSGTAGGRRPLSGEWEDHGEARTGRVRDRDGSAVRRHDLTGDGESEPGAAPVSGPGVVEAGEAFEDLILLLDRDTRAVVGDGEDDVGLGLAAT